MAYEIKVPPFGESITECTVAQWLVQDGGWAERGEPVVVIDSEKTSSDLTAEVSGRLKITVPAGTDATVGTVIGLIEEGAPPQQQFQPKTTPSAPPKAPVPPTPPISPTPPAPLSPSILSSLPAAPSTPPTPVTRQPMSRLRRTIAERMLAARHETAMLTTFNEADMTAVQRMRTRYQDIFLKRHGIKLGIMSPFIKAAAEALKAFPVINAFIEGNDIVYHHYYHIAVAVSTDSGLVTPVIRDSDRKTHAEIERELADLAQRARDGKLEMEDLQDATFTITNAGVYGSMMSTPLLNPPQSAILGIHAITERPVVVNATVQIRPMMCLALSYDHRLIDGKDAVGFLVTLKNYITEPERLLLGL